MSYNYVKLTKINLRKIFSPWSSSPANEYTKAEIVDQAMRILQGDSLYEDLEVSIGSFSNRSRCTGGRWKINRATQTIERLGENDKVIECWYFE